MSDNTFGALGVPAPLLSVLAKDGKTEAFPIQTDTLPDTLAGRDVLGRGRTGSGKTLAFSVPMVARLGGELAGGKRRPGRPLGLILAPTRELATQIDAVLSPLAAAYGLKTTTIYGGINQRRQVEALNAGVDIIVACPGRLEDLMNQGHVRLDAIEVTVLDEADHMADLGFLPVVTRILAATPANGQRMLFSATLDNGVDKIVKRFLHNPVTHSVDDETSPVEAMTHHVFFVNDADAKKALVEKLASGLGRRILFTRTKHHAKKLARQLTASGIPAVDLHGNLSQPQRDRNLAAFSTGGARVLVATDVAARGVHVDNVELVVHVDPPIEHKAYLHRSGRTARAGSAGTVATVCLPVQRDDLKKLLRKAAITVTPQTVTASSGVVVDLIGDEAPYVKPQPVAFQQQGGGKSQGANARRKRSSREGGPDAGQRSSGQRSSGQRSSGQRSSGRGERDDAPRRDRSGRPAAAQAGAGHSGQGRSGGRSGQGRSGQARSGQGRGSGTPSVYSTSSSGSSRPERTHRRVSSR